MRPIVSGRGTIFYETTKKERVPHNILSATPLTTSRTVLTLSPSLRVKQFRRVSPLSPSMLKIRLRQFPNMMPLISRKRGFGPTRVFRGAPQFVWIMLWLCSDTTWNWHTSDGMESSTLRREAWLWASPPVAHCQTSLWKTLRPRLSANMLLGTPPSLPKRSFSFGFGRQTIPSQP